ncbi:hypothetical protein PsYK624_085330 [Phanerochaete sordida]|uniref:Uncharacterized protein n=1 Tax=Phanerochaete sordida TaxID=48140 RepID=A0A9P3LF91_9APHY|nr:hypothetical protein PsYK624_085330 [Phanerochaete sordida]
MVHAAEQGTKMSRVERVLEARRHAATRFRERTPSVPPIVVVAPGSDESDDDTNMNLFRDSVLGSPKSAHGEARPMVLKARLEDESAFLHPHSAVDQRVRTSGRYRSSSITSDPRSCPASPASCNMPSPMVPPGALALQLDAHRSNIDHRYLEIAMEVAEEAARICDSPGPLPTDVPLVFAGINVRTVDVFRSWLLVRYNYRGHTRTLMHEAVTPEVLALDILEHAPEPDISLLGSGIIPIALASPLRAPSPRYPVGALLASPAPDARRARTPPFPVANGPARHQRTRAKKDLTLTLASSPLSATFAPRSPALASAPVRAPPRPHSAQRRATDPMDMAHDARSGKKAGFVVGLLAVGALLGSPSTPSAFRQTPRGGGAPPDPPSPFLNVSSPYMDLPRTPHSASGFAGWYGATRDLPPSSASRYVSPPELHSTSGSYFWLAPSPSSER